MLICHMLFSFINVQPPMFMSNKVAEKALHACYTSFLLGRERERRADDCWLSNIPSFLFKLSKLSNDDNKKRFHISFYYTWALQNGVLFANYAWFVKHVIRWLTIVTSTKWALAIAIRYWTNIWNSIWYCVGFWTLLGIVVSWEHVFST